MFSIKTMILIAYLLFLILLAVVWIPLVPIFLIAHLIFYLWSIKNEEQTNIKDQIRQWKLQLKIKEENPKLYKEIYGKRK